VFSVPGQMEILYLALLKDELVGIIKLLLRTISIGSATVN